jgi:DNA-binding XRE family transcriptional regulator
MMSFDDLYREIEQEAQAEGPAAAAEMRALQDYHGLWAEFVALRRRRRVTQAELARRSGVQQSEISRIERGTANPTVATLKALVDALGAELRLVDPKAELAEAGAEDGSG